MRNSHGRDVPEATSEPLVISVGARFDAATSISEIPASVPLRAGSRALAAVSGAGVGEDCSRPGVVAGRLAEVFPGIWDGVLAGAG
jgi:hypothetical protein